MTTSVILLASDHAGFDLKADIRKALSKHGLDVLDLGPSDHGAVDYPDMAERLVQALLDDRAARGILICGTGIGIGIAANRHRRIRAATCHDVTTARLARAHNDANVLCLGARVIGLQVALDCVDAFLETPFEGERHQRRVDKLGGA
ncbi:MAG: ribose 5-phosphate isomerase B [Alphaproteobacteria bacterium]|nr:ribose 5-phosphate isomerase B [Alphaproteobacteria bacterium]